MNNRSIILIFAGMLVILATFIFSQDKPLDINSEEITNLYTYLGTTDINRCNGLIFYGDKAITKSDLETTDLLCIAYYQLEPSQITADSAPKTGTNDSKIDICKIGENIIFTTDGNKSDICKYNVVKEEDIKNTYQKMFGQKLTKSINEFKPSNNKLCIKEGEEYLCGSPETYSVSLTPETDINRIINKATKKLNGNIIIYDYYLKISNNKCYTKNNNDENKDCTKYIEDNNLNLKDDNNIIELAKKYGSIYKHTFKPNTDKTSYYWAKTELK